MKNTISTLLIFLCATYNQAQEQAIALKDTLIKHSFESYNGSMIISFSDSTISFDDLPKPKDNNGEIPGVISYHINSLDKINNLAKQIFSETEINQMNENKCAVNLIALSSGKVVSASFLFTNNDPKICPDKLMEFSTQIKRKITVRTEFDSKIDQEGYIQAYLRILHNL
jgi:hypothetical protein